MTKHKVVVFILLLQVRCRTAGTAYSRNEAIVVFVIVAEL